MRDAKTREQDRLVVGERVRVHQHPSILNVGTVEEIGADFTYSDGDVRPLGYHVRITDRSIWKGELKFFSRMDLFRPTEQELRELKEEVEACLGRAESLLEELTEELVTLGDGARTDCRGCGEAWQVDDSDAKDPDVYCCRNCELTDHHAMESRG